MILSARLCPPNSIIFLLDERSRDLPSQVGNGTVTATKSCLLIKTLCSPDGPTTIFLADEAVPKPPDVYVAFEGTFDCPSKRLTLTTAENETVLRFPVCESALRVSVWVNDDSEPTEIFIQIMA